MVLDIFYPLCVNILAGNLILDGLIIFLGFFWGKAKVKGRQLRLIILKAWGFGFIADIIGAILLIVMDEIFPFLDEYNAWESPLSFHAYLLVIAFVGRLIYRFNNSLLTKEGLNERTARRTALAMGIITAPWLFLIPTRLTGL